MPLTPEMRRSIDQIRDYLFGGGYPDPVNNAEQLAFLFFFYLVEGIDAENAARGKVLKQKHESIFTGEWKLRNPLNAPAPGVTTIPRERFRWSVWANSLSGEALVLSRLPLFSMLDPADLVDVAGALLEALPALPRTMSLA